MSTANNVELIIITVILSIFFLLLCFFLIQIIRVMYLIKRVTKKAEAFISSAKSAAETLHKMGHASKRHFPLMHVVADFFNDSKRRGD